MKISRKIFSLSVITIAALGLILAGCSSSGTSTPSSNATLSPTLPDLIDEGFGTVLISQDIAANTAATITADVYSVDVPDNAFAIPVKFEILLGDPHAYEDSVPQGQFPILAFAFRVTDIETGQFIGEFAHPVQLTIYDPRIVPNSDYFNILPNEVLKENPNGLVATDGELKLVLVLIGVTLIIVTRFANLQDLIHTLSKARWNWILVGIALHILYFVLYAMLYKLGFGIVDIERRLLDLIPMVFASVLLNTLVPSGGASSGAMFIDDSSRRGFSGARAAAGLIVVLVADLGTLIPVIVLAVGYLIYRSNFQIYDIVGALIFVAFISTMIIGLIVARREPQLVLRFAKWLRNVINQVGAWFKHPDLLSKDWAERSSKEFSEAAMAISTHPMGVIRITIFGLFLHLVNVAGLYALFLAFEQKIALITLLTGYGIGIIFWNIAIIPQGLGAVEGIMGLVYTSLGIESSKAAGVILTFRGMNSWMPMLLGLISLRWIRTFKSNEKRPQEEEGIMKGRNPS
jgi:uncharacterized protein (TIRG00374 family)